MAEVIAVGIPSIGETERARSPTENGIPLSQNVNPPSGSANLSPKTVTPLSEHGSPPSVNGNVNLQPENCGPLAENGSPPIGNGSPLTGDKSPPNDHLDDFGANNKVDGKQINPRVVKEESSRASGGSTSNICHESVVPSNLNETGNTVESPKDFQTTISHPSEDDYCPKVSNSAMSNPSKKGQSDNVISKSVVSTARHLHSYFLDGSLPSYALPTVAFQIRISLTTDNVSQDDIPTCNRYKLPSPMCHRHKRRRSQSLDNGLQLESGLKSDRCISAQPWKASIARPKGRTPLHSLPVGQKSTRETESRPSSSRTDPSARVSSVKSLFTKEKSTSDSNSFQLLRKSVASAKSPQLSSSVNESELTSCVKNTAGKSTDRPKSMASRESPVSDDFSLKSKKPAWKQTTKVSPDKEFSSAHESGPRPKPVEKVVAPVESFTLTKEDKAKDKEVLSTSREPALKPAPEKATSPTKALHDKAPVRVPKPADDRNVTVGKQPGLKPALDTSIGKGSGTKAKQVTPAKTQGSDATAGSRVLSPTKAQHAKSSPTKEVSTLTEARKDLLTHSKVHSKPQEAKPSHNKDASIKRESKKVPTPSRESASFASLNVNKELKPTANESESNQQSQPIKSSAIEREKMKEVSTEKTCTAAESPAASQKEKEKESPMDEYRAKLAENRKLAREKAEREAEEERMKDEQARLAEEERKRLEEEEERRRDEEELRLAEEMRRVEEERYRRSVEETELRRREEAERTEAEVKAKAEQEALAKQEAEKLENLRQEKMKREEEEKQGRKKRLEAIMKRVKADESGTKLPQVEARNTAEHPPSDTVLNQSMERSSLDSSLQRDAISPVSLSDDSTAHFKSPLLQQLLTGRAKTQAVVVGNFLDSDKTSADCEVPETMSCLYEEQKTVEEPSRIVLSQEMAS